jgi:hypothetical protein
MRLDHRQEEQLRRLWGRADDDTKQDLTNEFLDQEPTLQEPTLAGSLFSTTGYVFREQWLDLFLSSLSPLAKQDLLKKVQACA